MGKDVSTLYVAPTFIRWDQLDLQPGKGSIDLPVSLQTPDGQPGVLLAFDSMEALVKMFPTIDQSRVWTIRVPSHED